MKCGLCDKEHALMDMEPAFLMPEAFVAIPVRERDRRAKVFGGDVVLLRENGAVRCFVRGVLPVTVTDRKEGTSWGLWAEVSSAALDRIMELWRSPAQGAEPPFDAKVANRVPLYEADTIGLPCKLQLVDPRRRPILTFEPSEHPFVKECLAGVTTHRLVEWLEAIAGDRVVRN
jgi:hypothetical protein